MTGLTEPVKVIGYETESGRNVTIFCPFCGSIHIHGNVKGTRLSHCPDRYSGQYDIALVVDGPMPPTLQKLGESNNKRFWRAIERDKPYEPNWPEGYPGGIDQCFQFSDIAERPAHILPEHCIVNMSPGGSLPTEILSPAGPGFIPDIPPWAADTIHPGCHLKGPVGGTLEDRRGRQEPSDEHGRRGRQTLHIARENMEHIAKQEDNPKCHPDSIPNSEQNGDDRKISNEEIARILTRLRNTPTKDLSVAERLILRAVDRQFTITLDSERGPIAVVCRVPTLAEYQDLVEMQKSILQVGAIALEGAAACTDIANGNGGDSAGRTHKLREMRTALHESKKSLADTQRRLSEILAAVTIDPSLTVNLFNAGILTHEEISLIVGSLLQRGQPHPLRTRMSQTPPCEG